MRSNDISPGEVQTDETLVRRLLAANFQNGNECSRHYVYVALRKRAHQNYIDSLANLLHMNMMITYHSICSVA